MQKIGFRIVYNNIKRTILKTNVNYVIRSVDVSAAREQVGEQIHVSVEKGKMH